MRAPLSPIASRIVCALVLATSSLSMVARAERFAVLPVDAERDGGVVSVRAAAAVRAALEDGELQVLAIEPTRAVLVDYLRRGGAELASYQKRLDQAEAALTALDEVSSLKILELLITDLAADPEFSREKQALLELARLKIAARLVGLAGTKETGKAETDNGKRAGVLLADALRANPKLAPSRDDFPPRFHLLFDHARSAIAARGTGGLNVDSRPRGATVLVEGRDVGKTPLTLGNDMLTKGSYRMWVEAAGAHSVPQVIEVGDRVSPVFVDLAFEGALWAEGPGLRPLAGNNIDEEVAKKIGRFLGVDTLLLVGKARYDDDADWLWGAAFTVAEGTTARRGAVRMGDDVSLAAAATTLAGFLGRGVQSGVEDRPLPASVLPPPARANATGSMLGPSMAPSPGEGELPWLAIGAVGGGVVLVGLAALGVYALVNAQPKERALVIFIEDLP